MRSFESNFTSNEALNKTTVYTIVLVANRARVRCSILAIEMSRSLVLSSLDQRALIYMVAPMAVQGRNGLLAYEFSYPRTNLVYITT